jgi:hypothetical protein
VSVAPHKIPPAGEDEPPPILGSWRRIYIVVLWYLAFLILAFYIFGRIVRS